MYGNDMLLGSNSILAPTVRHMDGPGTTAIGVFWMAPGSETSISLLALVIGASSKGQTHVTGLRIMD